MIQDETFNTEMLQWHDKYVIGIPELDKQHKDIFCKINKIAGVIALNQPQEVIFQLFDELRQYTEFHSQTEYKYYQLLPDCDKQLHQLQHKLIRQQMEELKSDYQKNNLSDVEILQCLADWFVDHILHEDSKLKRLIAG